MTAAKSNGRVLIDLTDNGPGISPANAPKIFEPFFTTTRAQGGTGLGLPIARAITRAAGGEITLLPSTQGAQFRIDLPLTN
jgi:signal transduction histidine kinase